MTDYATLAALLAEHYHLRLHAADPLPGEFDLNIRVAASALVASSDAEVAPAPIGTYVLKVAGRQRSAGELAFQTALLDHLSAAELPVATPRLIRLRDGAAFAKTRLVGPTLAPDSDPGDTRPDDTDERFVHLLTWVEGRPLREFHDRPESLLRDWGRMAGALSAALADFTHPGAHRDLVWDPRHAARGRRHLALIADPSRRQLAERLFDLVDAAQLADRTDLRRSVCYADAHEDNLLFARGNDHTAQLTGLIDVGDAVYTYTVCELAIACAYAAMDQPDPLGAFGTVTRGYVERFALDEAEAEALYPLIVGRLLTTVTQSALARRDDPENAYRSVSEEQAWALLGQLAAVPPVLAKAHLRHAAGYEACPQAARFRSWLAEQPVLNAVMDVSPADLGPLDCSVGSRELGNYSDYSELPRFERHVRRLLEDRNLDVGYGGYLETRPFYTTALFERPGNSGPRWRTVHLGLDLWTPAGKAVYAPVAGRIHGFRQNDGPRDYGATIILSHEVEVATAAGKSSGPLRFYTLYGHLSSASLAGLRVGDEVPAGTQLATIGAPQENGGWPPHLHFQVMLDDLGLTGDFPGVAFPEEQEIWASLCPDPGPLSGLPVVTRRDPSSGAEISRLSDRRRARLGRSLSISYARPLHIVRGVGAYLLDVTGRRYLDTVNNVAHVGHEHPAVVAAIAQQAAVLNTNTRYLHEELVAFAEELCATLPPELSVVHVVNSGSEANELALRMARAATGQRDVIAVEVGYHGNTGAVIDVSSYKFDGRGGAGAPTTTQIVPMPDVYAGLYRDAETAGEWYAGHVDAAIARIREQGRDGPAAFLCESILSCGGQVVLPKGYLAAAYAKTRAAGGLCIADEVQVGLGRVGSHFWGFELQGVVPDVVVIGKPLGNGHPLAAVVSTAGVADAFAATGMEYFNTFGGNPVSCAAGRAVLRVLREEGLQAHAEVIGQRLLQGLRELQQRHEAIGDVRGAGLFLGFELVRDRETRQPDAALTTYLANRARERGLLLSTDGPRHNVIKLKPPLCFGERDADFLLAELDQMLQR